MYKPRYYEIHVELEDGTRFHAFTWKGNKRDGFAAARNEAKERNLKVVRIWAIPTDKEK